MAGRFTIAGPVKELTAIEIEPRKPIVAAA
jgi:hypothetical protein